MGSPRIIAGLCAGVLAVALSGCGSSGHPGVPDASAQASQAGPGASEFDGLDAAVTACTGPQLAGYPTGACSQRGLHCIASDTECCDCLHADLKSCGVPSAWACGDALQKPCPPTPPVQGSPCDAGQLANSGCTYCVPPGGSYTCQKNAWERTLDYLYCQTPLEGLDGGGL